MLTTAQVDFMDPEPIRSEPTSLGRERSPLSWKTKVPMWEFYAQGVKLRSKQAVAATIYKEADLWVAECEALSIFGYSASYDGLIQDFNEQVVHFFGRYSSASEDDVTGLALQLRQVYNENFEIIP